MKSPAPSTNTLLEVLKQLAPDSSMTTLRSWILDGRITVDGRVAKIPKMDIRQGQQIALGEKPTYLFAGVRVVYEDRDIVVVEKPEGLLSVDTDTGLELSLHEILKRRFHTQRVYPVHRLDKDTSGVMMFAYSEAARDHLKEAFFHHNITREYMAVVKGVFKEPEGTWSSYLYEDITLTVRPSNNESGQLAITHYKVLGKNQHYTALKLSLETGRKHQIRVHCQIAGHPVVGDEKYGGPDSSRLHLHAQFLSLNHPTKNKVMTFHSPPPESFFKLVSML